MSVKKSAEQIIVTHHDFNWIRLRALLLLIGTEENHIPDFSPVEEIETEIGTGDLSPKSTEFPDFNIFFKTL